MKVVTLPITPGVGRLFTTLLNPLVADLVAYSLLGELRIMLNTVGIPKLDKQAEAPEVLLQVYRNHLDGLGIAKQTPCFHDGSQDFEDYFQDVLKRLLQKGHLTQTRMEISACACGRVEIPTEALARVAGEYRRKKLIRLSPPGFICEVCKSILISTKENVAVCRFRMPEQVSIFPSLFEKEVDVTVSRIMSYPTVISRNRREFSQIKIGEYTSSADTDFRWATFLGYIIPETESGILVASATTLNQAVKVLMLDQLLTGRARCSIVAHPLIRIHDQQISLSGLSAEAFLSLCGLPYVSRTFLSLGLRWDTMEGIVDSGNLHLIQKSLPRRMWVNSVRQSPIMLEKVQKLFGRQTILNLLKKFRNRDSLTEDEEFLLGFLEPRM